MVVTHRMCSAVVLCLNTKQLFNMHVLVCHSMMQDNIMIQYSILQKVAVYYLFSCDRKQKFGRLIFRTEYCTGSTSDEFNSMNLLCYSFGGRV